jgi:hypothetical protein
MRHPHEIHNTDAHFIFCVSVNAFGGHWHTIACLVGEVYHNFWSAALGAVSTTSGISAVLSYQLSQPPRCSFWSSVPFVIHNVSLLSIDFQIVGIIKDSILFLQSLVYQRCLILFLQSLVYYTLWYDHCVGHPFSLLFIMLAYCPLIFRLWVWSMRWPSVFSVIHINWYPIMLAYTYWFTDCRYDQCVGHLFSLWYPYVIVYWFTDCGYDQWVGHLFSLWYSYNVSLLSIDLQIVGMISVLVIFFFVIHIMLLSIDLQIMGIISEVLVIQAVFSM